MVIGAGVSNQNERVVRQVGELVSHVPPSP